MISFADTLANNNRLRGLDIDNYHETFSITYNGYVAFTAIWCYNASIMSTYQSNHTLERLCRFSNYGNHYNEGHLPEDLRSLLLLNRDHSNSQSARLKIIKTHFSGNNINLKPFTDMKRNILLHVIAWMARDDSFDSNRHSASGMSVMYRLFCDMLTLLENVKNRPVPVAEPEPEAEPTPDADAEPEPAAGQPQVEEKSECRSLLKKAKRKYENKVDVFF